MVWSRDGRTVNFVRESGFYDWEVMAIPREGGTPGATGLGRQALLKTPSEQATAERFERLGAMLHAFGLHPDGLSLLFSSELNPKLEVWALDGVVAATRR